MNSSLNTTAPYSSNDNLEIEYTNDINLFRAMDANERIFFSAENEIPAAPVNLKYEEDFIDKPALKEDNCSCPKVVEVPQLYDYDDPTPIGNTTFSFSSKYDETEENSYNLLQIDESVNELESFISEDNLNEAITINMSNTLTPKTLTAIEVYCNKINTSLPKFIKKKYQNNTRKYKPDSIRKKIKSRTLKNFKQKINHLIKTQGGKYFFDYFPQIFVSNIIANLNKEVLNLSMRELLLKDFGGKAKDKDKLKYNTRVLLYLDENPDIRKKSGIDFLLKCSLKIILDNYFSSPTFKEDLQKLKNEGEDDEYIIKYEHLGNNWIYFYENDGKMPDKCDNP